MSKYKSQKIIIDNIKFDSKAESEYYKLLKKMEKEGKIKNIELQPIFILQDEYVFNSKKVRAITYVADFKYEEVDTKQEIVIDVKGMPTEVANIKRKMFNCLYSHRYKLKWVAKSIKFGKNGFCDYDELKRIRRDNKKKK